MVQLNDRKGAKYMMLVLEWYEIIDQLGMENSLHWNGHVLKREDVLRKALDFRLTI